MSAFGLRGAAHTSSHPSLLIVGNEAGFHVWMHVWLNALCSSVVLQSEGCVSDGRIKTSLQLLSSVQVNESTLSSTAVTRLHQYRNNCGKSSEVLDSLTSADALCFPHLQCSHLQLLFVVGSLPLDSSSGSGQRLSLIFGCEFWILLYDERSSDECWRLNLTHRMLLRTDPVASACSEIINKWQFCWQTYWHTVLYMPMVVHVLVISYSYFSSHFHFSISLTEVDFCFHQTTELFSELFFPNFFFSQFIFVNWSLVLCCQVLPGVWISWWILRGSGHEGSSWWLTRKHVLLHPGELIHRTFAPQLTSSFVILWFSCAEHSQLLSFSSELMNPFTWVVKGLQEL